MTTKAIINELKRIKKQADYQDYGWSDLEDDIDALIKKIKGE